MLEIETFENFIETNTLLFSFGVNIFYTIEIEIEIQNNKNNNFDKIYKVSKPKIIHKITENTKNILIQF